jgi:hypothetical protein
LFISEFHLGLLGGQAVARTSGLVVVVVIFSKAKILTFSYSFAFPLGFWCFAVAHTAIGHFMNQKGFHPSNYQNQKKVSR